MYSRRFYSTQRGRPSPMPQNMQNMRQNQQMQSGRSPDINIPKPETKDIKKEEAFSRWEVNIPSEKAVLGEPLDYINPRDFAPEKEVVPTISIKESSVYPEVGEVPGIPEMGKGSEEESEITAEASATLKNMTLEDMMLAGLLMLGSSGEYDDDIMLILGLILMIGM